MHTVVIYQRADDIHAAVAPLIDMGGQLGNVQASNGSFARIESLQQPIGPRGADGPDRRAYGTIVDFADKLLVAVLSDDVPMRIVFAFHQTDERIVRSINQVIALFYGTGVLHDLARRHGKNLHVTDVFLLSCESATDKSVQAPISPVQQTYADQAAEMRKRAMYCLVVPHVPPPGYNIPTVWTFTTGNAETGGVTVNPFHVEFRELAGHFNPDGSWSYDDPVNPDHQGKPAAGVIYRTSAAAEDKQPMPAGSHINVMGFDP